MNTPNCLSTVSTYPLGGGLAGLVTTGSVKGMLIGAVSGAAFAGIGNAFAAGGRFAGAGSRFVNAAGKLSNAGRALKIGLHGLAGGTRSVLSGGKFKAGFLASGFAQTAAPAINHIDSDVGKVVAAGVAGGVGSEIAGGSFEDGFVTGVFSRALNEEIHGDHESPTKRLFKIWLSGSGDNEKYTKNEFSLIQDSVNSGRAAVREGDSGKWSGGTYQGYDFTNDPALADAVGKGYVIFDHSGDVVGASDYYDFGYEYYPVNAFKIFGAKDYYISYGPLVCVPTHNNQGFCY